jgi:predicted GNAT superfamily acetyltransferase
VNDRPHIRQLTTAGECAQADELQRAVWRIDRGSAPAPSEVLTVVRRTGGYVGGAWLGDRLAGILVGFIGYDARTARVSLHTHVICAAVRERGIGRALLLDQRDWCLARGIDTVEWTFDPLVRRNAHLYLTRLGAAVLEYVENYYGVLDDAINRADESDRLVVRWSLTDPGHDGAALPPRGDIRPLLTQDETGRPRAHRLRVADAPIRMSCAIPEDIEELRRRDPEGGVSWRLAVRHSLGAVLASGGRVLGLTDDGRYLLEGKAP